MPYFSHVTRDDLRAIFSDDEDEDEEDDDGLEDDGFKYVLVNK